MYDPDTKNLISSTLNSGEENIRIMGQFFGNLKGCLQRFSKNLKNNYELSLDNKLSFTNNERLITQTKEIFSKYKNSYERVDHYIKK